MSEPWLENPESLDAQIALMREMQKARLVAAGGDRWQKELYGI